ncbi:hypothetical protein Tco_0577744 [Tanacetum coccineum]
MSTGGGSIRQQLANLDLRIIIDSSLIEWKELEEEEPTGNEWEDRKVGDIIKPVGRGALAEAALAETQNIFLSERLQVPFLVGIRFVKVSLKIGFIVGAFQIVVGFVVGFGNLVEMPQKRLVEIQKKFVARESSELG